MDRLRSQKRIVTWCRDSGDKDQKSHIAEADMLFSHMYGLN
jgi:hypothetical protein